MNPPSYRNAARRVHIRTYGCQMNERDSEALECLLAHCGFDPCEREEDADVLIFNTCSVRETAERKAIGKVQLMKRLKRRRPELVIGIVGCMAQNRGQELLDTMPHLDFVAGTDQLHRVPDMVIAALEGRGRRLAIDSGHEILGRLTGHRDHGVSAFVAVMRGCNQFCSYCIVPYTRGREKSRPAGEILDEVQALASRGVREVMLLGQNVTAYGIAEARHAGTHAPHNSPFADLLRAVNGIDAIHRIRFTSPHVRYMNDAFVEAVTSLPKVCESLHVPLQSGSDRILEAMKRGYTAAEYRERLEALRARCPEITFSTDVIVGFPGETDEDFQATRRLMADIGYDMAYIFKYSPRPGTLAAGRPDNVAAEVKEERNQLLLTDLDKRNRTANRRFLGRTVEVLVEGPSKRNPERWQGRTRTAKVTIFTPPPETKPGHLLPVHVNRVTASTLFGDPVPSTEAQ